MAETLEVLLEDCYHELGYAVIRVPVSTIKKRADVILEEVSTS
jgi:predicted ATPase